MTKYEPIACDFHDQLEVVCLRGDPVTLFLTDGTAITGVPRTTLVTPDKEEFLVVDTGDGECRVRMDRIRQLCRPQK